MEEKVKSFVELLKQNRAIEITLHNKKFNAISIYYSGNAIISNNFFLLLPEIIDVLEYDPAPEPEIFDTTPETIFTINNALQVPDFTLNSNNGINAIITKDEFLYALMKRLRCGLIIWE